MNGSYVFGYTTQERQVYIGSDGASNPFYRTQLQLKGFKADIGAQYQLDLDQKKGRSLVVGATFALRSSSARRSSISTSSVPRIPASLCPSPLIRSPHVASTMCL